MSFTADINELVEANENGLLSVGPSWARIQLRKVSQILNGYPFDSKKFTKDAGVPLIRIRDINSARTDACYSGDVPDGFWVQHGEIVIGMDGDFNAARWKGGPALLNQRVAKVSPDESFFDRRFYFYALGGYLQAINANTPSVTVKHLSSKTIGDIPLPLPPRAEQALIADKLDTLLARIDTVRERLDRVPVLLKRFRRSVLVAATSGELTGDWRAGKEAEWKYLRAADVCAKVQSGGTPKEGFAKSGVPFLKVYNIVEQQVSFEYRPQYIANTIHSGSMAKSVTKPGDILMNIVGPPLGKVAIVPDAHAEWNINQAIALFRPSELISTGWLYYVLCSGKNIEDIILETKGMVGQQNISLSQCRDFVFPIPTIEEQAEIVRRVEALFALAGKAQAQYESARSRVDKLTLALLAKAFRGELVPQDPSDEPAEDLLERLRSAKANETKPVKRSRKSPAVLKRRKVS